MNPLAILGSAVERLRGDIGLLLEHQPNHVVNSDNLRTLVQLRWAAVFGQVLTLWIVHHHFGFILQINYHVFLLGLLVFLNSYTIIWLEGRQEISTFSVAVALLLDVAALTAQLWLSGGTENPFTAIYLLQIALAAMMLDFPKAVSILLLVLGALVFITLLHLPLVSPQLSEPDMARLKVHGTIVALGLDGLLLLILINRISGNLRLRNRAIEAMRERALEESHIVEMGLLASGAAHELGSPLSAIAVTLSDWARMPQFRKQKHLQLELSEMQTAIKRCKLILTQVLTAAGDTHGDSAQRSTLRGMIEDIARDWRQRHNCTTLQLGIYATGSITVVANSAFRQALFNLLDNAFEVSPEFISLAVWQNDDDLAFVVTDKGPGIPQAVMKAIGKPYITSKTGPGRGLGLFLAANVARKLGGKLVARNSSLGGAEVIISLPLSSIIVPA